MPLFRTKNQKEEGSEFLILYHEIFGEYSTTYREGTHYYGDEWVEGLGVRSREFGVLGLRI